MTTDARWTTDEEALAAAVATWLDRNWDAAKLAEASSDVAELWSELRDQVGLSGLLLPERFGGQGASPREAAIVARELGRSMLPTPFLMSDVLCAPMIAEHTADDDFVRGLASGRHTVSLAVPHTRFVEDDLFSAFSLQDGRLRGGCRAVIDGGTATHLLVPARAGGVPVLAVVACDDAGVGRQLFLSVDQTRGSADVSLTDTPAIVIAQSDSAESGLRQGLLRAIAVQCAEQAGLARHCLDLTIAYALTRTQFGRQIGSFQAIKHRMAEMWWLTTTVEGAAEGASALLEGPQPLNLADLYAARVSSADYTVRVIEECLQLHGGIGMTWEGGIHAYLKRAKANQVLFGSSGRYIDAIARELELT